MYRSLDPAQIIATLDQLQARIRERFPTAGLTKVCADMCDIARRSHQRATAIERPAYLLRAVILVLIAAGLGTLGTVAKLLVTTQQTSTDLFSTIQAVDATFNIAILTGAAIFFLVSLEERIKRRRALRALNELRSIAHVIDMHQLTKDPANASALSGTTASSPQRLLTAPELIRYLDYCSEMLSLAAKVAAIYAQSSKDPLVIEASSDLQQITANLSAKIWQKINIAQAGVRADHAAAAPAVATAAASRSAGA